MKRILTLIVAICMAYSAFPQAPEQFSYQAVIRDAQGDLVSNQSVTVNISILEGNSTGTTVFEEEHSITTNDNGLATLVIGNGLNTFGDISSVSWGDNAYYLKIETDPDGGNNFSITATTQLLSVPYALYANEAGSAPGTQGPAGPQGNAGDDGISVTGVSIVNDSLQVTLSNGNTINAGLVSSAGALEEITEGSNTGYRIVGRDTANHGDIGDNAVDLSYFPFASTTNGASGQSSTAMGYNTTASGIVSTAMGHFTIASGDFSTAMGESTTASGDFSTAMGESTTASERSSTAMGGYTRAFGDYSTAMGYFTTAPSYSETAIGLYNTLYIPAAVDNWNPADRLFVVGNGTSTSARSDALVVLKNGNVGVGNSDPEGQLFVQQSGAGVSTANGIYLDFQGDSWKTYHSGLHYSFANEGARYAYVEDNTGNYVISSDKNLKTNIQELPNVMEGVLRLNPVSYVYKSSSDPTASTLGFLAQEVGEVFPDVVRYAEDGTPSLAYDLFSILPIKAIQEQQAMIDEQQFHIAKQQEQIESLIKEINAVKNMLRDIQ